MLVILLLGVMVEAILVQLEVSVEATCVEATVEQLP